MSFASVPIGKYVLRIAVAGLLLGGVAWIVLHPRPEAPRMGRRGGSGTVPVTVAPVVKGDIPVTVHALGTVTPLATVTIKTQIAGQLQQIAFTEGQLVHKGDFLAQIDPRPYQAQLDQYLGQLNRDVALLAEAEIDLKRYKVLVAEDSIASQQLDTQASLVAQYRGAVETDKAQVASARLNLAYCHIVSPITGRVGLRQVDQGNYVQTSDANGLVVITQLQPITVVFTVPEDAIPAIAKRVHAGAQLPVTAFDRSASTKLAEGRVLSLDNQIDTTTGTVKIRAVFDNTDESLFPNQFVNATLDLDVIHDQVVVPSSAIQRGAPGTFVYALQPDNTVAVKVVTLGQSNGDVVAATAGLQLGDQVVVDGTDKLRDGAAVTVGGQGGAPSADRPKRDKSKRKGDDDATPAPAPGEQPKPAEQPKP